MTAKPVHQDADIGVTVMAPGSEQYPAPRRGDPPTYCSECGSEMMFNPIYLVDGGTWTCSCESGLAQQRRQFQWFVIMIVVFLLIAGLAV